jgi:hypothetical protein
MDIEYRYAIKYNRDTQQLHVYRIHPDGTYSVRRNGDWAHVNVVFKGLSKSKGYRYWTKEVSEKEAFAEAFIANV